MSECPVTPHGQIYFTKVYPTKFVMGGTSVATLGIVWGSRRVGKSGLLESAVEQADGQERQVDLVVAADDALVPTGRTICAIGEAKAGERITAQHVTQLEEIRTALGPCATAAKILLFGVEFAPDVHALAVRRDDLELIDLVRLYDGE